MGTFNTIQDPFPFEEMEDSVQKLIVEKLTHLDMTIFEQCSKLSSGLCRQFDDHEFLQPCCSLTFEIGTSSSGMFIKRGRQKSWKIPRAAIPLKIMFQPRLIEIHGEIEDEPDWMLFIKQRTTGAKVLVFNKLKNFGDNCRDIIQFCKPEEIILNCRSCVTQPLDFSEIPSVILCQPFPFSAECLFNMRVGREVKVHQLRVTPNQLCLQLKRWQNGNVEFNHKLMMFEVKLDKLLGQFYHEVGQLSSSILESKHGNWRQWHIARNGMPEKQLIVVYIKKNEESGVSDRMHIFPKGYKK